MKKFVLILLLGLFINNQANAADLIAKVNRNQVPLGETFILTIQYNEDPKELKPDFAPLNNNFVIYSISNSYNTSYINGKTSRNYQWNIALSPKEVGELTIPALKMANLETKPIKLKVTTSASNSEGAIASSFSIERNIDNSTPFVQEQIIYNLTIKTSEPLQGSSPIFMDNGQNEWVIRDFGQPTVRSEIIDGIEVKSVDFKYAFFPQKSGDLTIPEARFEGYYINPNAPRSRLSLLGSFFNDDIGFNPIIGQKVPVILTAKPINIKVEKTPSFINGKWWLPAKQVEISSNWQDTLPTFRTGEAVTREISIKVTGALDTQLPKLDFVSVSGIKQYPEKPETTNEAKENNVISTMKVTNVYIPQHSGKIELPEIGIDWYNVTTNKLERAILPSISINVEKGQFEESIKSQNTSEMKQGADIVSTPILAQANNSPDMVYIYILIAFILGLSLSYFIFRPKNKPVLEKEVDKTICMSKAVKCNDLKAMRDSVLAWARNYYKDDNISNLNDIAKLVSDEEFQFQIYQLSAALYAKKDVDFNPGIFLKVFDRVAKEKKKASNKKEKLLPDLYK